MKKIFEFTLPEDIDDFRIYNQAGVMHSVLHSMQEYLVSKYNHVPHRYKTRVTELEEIRKEFFDLMIDYGVEL